MKRYVMLCEGAFDEDAKTATGVLRYADAITVAVIDSTRAGSTADAEVPGLAEGIPIVATLAETLADRPDTLLIGVAPAGGKLPESFRSVVKEALEQGLDVENGLHDFLAGDPELAAAAAAGGAEIRDLRRPPDDLDVPTLANPGTCRMISAAVSGRGSRIFGGSRRGQLGVAQREKVVQTRFVDKGLLQRFLHHRPKRSRAAFHRPAPRRSAACGPVGHERLLARVATIGIPSGSDPGTSAALFQSIAATVGSRRHSARAGRSLCVLIEHALAQHHVALHGHGSSGVTPNPRPGPGE